MNAVIRESVLNDFDSIAGLLGQLWPGKQLCLSDLKVVFERGLSSDIDYYLCSELDREVVGFLSLNISNSFWQEGYTPFVNALVVDEAHRGSGIGKSLLERAYEISRQRGCGKIELDSAFHRKGAHKFYERLGFEKRAYMFSKDL